MPNDGFGHKFCRYASPKASTQVGLVHRAHGGDEMRQGFVTVLATRND